MDSLKIQENGHAEIKPSNTKATQFHIYIDIDKAIDIDIDIKIYIYIDIDILSYIAIN